MHMPTASAFPGTARHKYEGKDAQGHLLLLELHTCKAGSKESILQGPGGQHGEGRAQTYVSEWQIRGKAPPC